MTTTPAPVAWRMVPCEPDEAMTLAGRNAAQSANAHSVGWSAEAKAVWSAMCAASPAPDLEGVRERVARVIDPQAWFLTDRACSLGMAAPSHEWFEASLAKADAILSLLFTPTEGEGRE